MSANDSEQLTEIIPCTPSPSVIYSSALLSQLQIRGKLIGILTKLCDKRQIEKDSIYINAYIDANHHVETPTIRYD